MRDSLRQLLRTRVLPDRGVRRAHIIGCARSGTTMLHYAMAAFEKVTLHPVESDLKYTPSLFQSLSLCRKPRGSWLVTKREFGWFKPDAVNEMIEHIVAENIAVINVVRDPRDVLVSKHAGNGQRKFYVHPERWQASINAGKKIVTTVADHVPTLTLRYEDIVMNSQICEEQLIAKLGLVKNQNVGGIAQLEDNITLTGTATNPWMKKALHKLRNFDQRSIGAWKQDAEKHHYLNQLLNRQPELRRAMVEFMLDHEYSYAQSA